MKHAAVKPMQVKGLDLKYLGNEPEWSQGLDRDQGKLQLVEAFNWYNYHCDKKQAKQMLADWLQRQSRSDDAKAVLRANDGDINTTVAWMSRISVMGGQLLDQQLDKINTFVAGLAGASDVPDTAHDIDTAIAKPNIQERLHEKMIKAGGELEGLYDDMVLSAAKPSNDYRPIDVLQNNNVAPQMLNEIVTAWQLRLKELQEVLEGRDADLVEGYSNHGRIKLKNMIRFTEQVLADCVSYAQLKKAGRKPRKKKPVSAEKLTRRFKFLKDFAELGLVSEPVTKLVNATEAWLYDTKRRKLIHVVADEHFKTFSVKGSALIGFDATHSIQKTLRRPGEQLKAILGASAANARKAFRNIKATESKFKGRGNAHLILLRIR